MVQELVCVRMSDRWLDEVILQATVANVGIDDEYRVLAPADEQDLAIMNAMVGVIQITTMVASINDWGVVFTVLSAAPSVVDLGNTARFVKTSAAEAYCSLDPDALVLWRKGEKVALSIPEIDTNASPTGDVYIRFKCVRVRPIEGAPLPLQLVR